MRVVSSTPSRLPRTVFCPQQSQQNPCGAKPQSTFLKLWDMTKHHIMRSCINQAECSRMLSCKTECFPRGKCPHPKCLSDHKKTHQTDDIEKIFKDPKFSVESFRLHISISPKIPGFSWLLPTHRCFSSSPSPHTMRALVRRFEEIKDPKALMKQKNHPPRQPGSEPFGTK